MRVLILWSDDLSANLGVRVLAVGTEALIRRIWPDAEVVYQNFGQRNPHLPIGRVSSMLKERVTGSSGMLKWLAAFDFVVDTRAGDSFADIYGLGRLRSMSAVSEFATQAGTPVILGPQTIGPFTTRQGRAIGRHSLRRAALSMARDSESAAYAKRIGRPTSIVTTDVVFALPSPQRTEQRDVLLNVSGLLWNSGPHVNTNEYRSTLTKVYRELVAQGRTVSLLAHVLDSTSADNDVPAIREFAEHVDPNAEILIPSGLSEVRSMVASSRLVIASRMHACLNALSVGTAALPLAYSRKFDPLLRDLGWTHTVDLRSSADPTREALEHVDALSGVGAEDVPRRAQVLLATAEKALRNTLGK